MAGKPLEPADYRCVCKIVEALKSNDPVTQDRGLRQLRAKYAFWLRGEIKEMLEQRRISEHYADDLLKLTLESIVKRIHAFNHLHSPPAKFPIWMRRFAFNYVRNLDRRLHPKGERPNRSLDAAARLPLVSLDRLGDQWNFHETHWLINALAADPTTMPPELIIEAQDLHDYFLTLHEETLERLHPLHRAIIAKHCMEGVSLRDIAMETNYSYPYVRNQSTNSNKAYLAAFQVLLDEQELKSPHLIEYIKQIRQLIVAYGESHE